MYEHFLLLEQSFRNHACGCVSNIMYGIHHDYGMYYERNGFFKLINKTICPKTGFYKGDFIAIGQKPKLRSFFPSDWSVERIMDEIIYALQSPSKKIVPEGSTNVITSFTRCGTVILIVLDINDAVKTVYPILP